MPMFDTIREFNLVLHLRQSSTYGSWECLYHGRAFVLKVNNTEFCLECILHWLWNNGLEAQ